MRRILGDRDTLRCVIAVLFDHHRSRDTQRLLPKPKRRSGARCRLPASGPRVRDTMSQILRTRGQGPVSTGSQPSGAIRPAPGQLRSTCLGRGPLSIARCEAGRQVAVGYPGRKTGAEIAQPVPRPERASQSELVPERNGRHPGHILSRMSERTSKSGHPTPRGQMSRTAKGREGVSRCFHVRPAEIGPAKSGRNATGCESSRR